MSNESTVVEVCGEFFPGGSECMLGATCSFHRSFHRQEDISIYDFFWDNLGSFSGGKESPWEEYFWSANDSPSLLPLPPPTVPARRQRTKFTEKQVAEMEKFAGASGWRRRRRDRAVISEFCQRIDVHPEKYKNWLKNRKQAAKRKRG